MSGAAGGDVRPRRWPPRRPYRGRSEGPQRAGPVASQWVERARCTHCKRVVLGDYLVLWGEPKTGRNQWGPYARPFYVQLCWRCVLQRANGRP